MDETSTDLRPIQRDDIRNARVLGICFMIIGALFTVDGIWPGPVRWLRVGVGLMFVIVGILRFRLARPVVPPAA